jgi:L-seryl-tRNA(Ser) seleniumtransferase
MEKGMNQTMKQELLRQLPSVDGLLRSDPVETWVSVHPKRLVTDCIRQVVEEIRRQILEDESARCGPAHVKEQFILDLVSEQIDLRTRPHLRTAINATGIILHTGLGRAVWAESVADSLTGDLKGYVTLAIDRETGERSERDQVLEYVLTELTGAESATVVNNNAAATMIVLTALARGKEVIISRGQLIEIGGSFRLPDVMSLSGAKMVEVGATNRTHLRDYETATSEDTAAIMRVHPSNFRIVGFTKEVPLEELSELAHSRGLIMIDDLGSGALIDLARYGLPHEPTVAESIAAGTDVALFSADKLIGASQGGIIVGKKEYIEQIRKHPLYRALRCDKASLMVLERPLHLFRDPDELAKEHPTYRMLATPTDVLEERARRLGEAIAQAVPEVIVETVEGVGYLGSGSLPAEQLPTFLVSVGVQGVTPSNLTRELRMDEACIFARIEDGRVLMDVRTISDDQVLTIAVAMKRISQIAR